MKRKQERKRFKRRGSGCTGDEKEEDEQGEE